MFLINAPSGEGGYEYSHTASGGVATDGVATIPGLAIGAADTGRAIIACIGANGTVTSTGSINAVTIGGVSATILRSDNSNAYSTSVICRAIVPSGTTADVVVSSAGSNRLNTVGVGLFRLLGAAATLAAEAGATGTGTSLDPGALSVPAGSTLFAIKNAGGGHTHVWAEMAELWQQGPDPDKIRSGAVHRSWTAKTVTASLTWTGSTTASLSVGVIAPA